jgi:hypothetical protein
LNSGRVRRNRPLRPKPNRTKAVENQAAWPCANIRLKCTMPKPVGVKVPVTVPVAVAALFSVAAVPLGSIEAIVEDAATPVPDTACPRNMPFERANLITFEPFWVVIDRVKADAAAIRHRVVQLLARRRRRSRLTGTTDVQLRRRAGYRDTAPGRCPPA